MRKFFELALTSNPNILELFFIPRDCLKIISPIYEKIVANRNLFINKRAKFSFSGYAYAQLSKATGMWRCCDDDRCQLQSLCEGAGVHRRHDFIRWRRHVRPSSGDRHQVHFHLWTGRRWFAAGAVRDGGLRHHGSYGSDGNAGQLHAADRRGGVRSRPKHHPNFHRFQRWHRIFSPCFLRASNISNANFTAAADSAGAQSTGGFPSTQH